MSVRKMVLPRTCVHLDDGVKKVGLMTANTARRSAGTMSYRHNSGDIFVGQ